MSSFFKKELMYLNHTWAMSQAITEGSDETRSMEKTLFFTLFASFAFPGNQLLIRNMLYIHGFFITSFFFDDFGV